MASTKRLGALRITYFDHQPSRAGVTVEKLHEAGLTGAQSAGTIAAVQEAVLSDQPHTLMLNMDDADLAVELIMLVRRMRRGRIGGDPFIAAVACHSAVTTELARKFAAAGFDQILSAPIEAETVILHLREMAARPRRFVADRGYVGPDRRRVARDAGETGTMEVPNRMAAALAGANFDKTGYDARAASWRAMLARIETA